MKDFHFDVFNDTNGVSRANVSGSTLVQFENVAASFKALGKTNEATNTFDKTMLSGTINFCSISKGTVGYFFLNFDQETLRKYSNFSFDCPQKKGFYYASNFPMLDDQQIPPFLRISGTNEVHVLIKGKIKNVKSMVLVGSFRAYFKIIPNH